MAKTYSTRQAALHAGIHWVTLLRWVSAGKVRASQSIKLNGAKHWRWTNSDVERLRNYKAARYGKREGRKPKKRSGPRRRQ